MIEMKFSKNDEEDGLFRISSRDIVGFYNCSSKQERKITDIIKCYGTTKSIKEVELKNMKPEDNVTVSRYIERNVGSIINKDYVIEGFLGMGKLSDCKDEMVSRLDISKRYCLEILVAFLQEAVNNPVPVSLLSGDRKPQIRFLGNHHSGSGNLYHKSFRM